MTVHRHLARGPLTFLWQRVTSVIVGWLAVHTCTSKSELPKLLWNFNTIYAIYRCGRGPDNTAWRAAGWKTHNLVPRLSMSGAMLLLPLPAVMV